MAPAGLDASFWDAEKGEIKFDDLGKELAALKTFKAEAEAKFAGVPDEPGKYEVKLPDDFKLPDGIEINVDDPRVGMAREIAHKAGLTQEQFSRMIQIDAQIKAAEAKQFAEVMAAEAQKIGPDGGKARVGAIETALAARVGPEHMKHIRAMIVSAAQVNALEALVKSMSTQGGTSAAYQPGGGAPQGMTEDAWARMTPTEKFNYAYTKKAS